MKHGSLFSGIGGFDLAAEWMGWYNVFHCEWNEFGQKILKYYWPNAISYGDITKTDFSIHRGSIDILTGGFPCQPYSTAGKRLGKEDERHLWPEMLRAIREILPHWIVGENVRGLTNWNGGVVFDEVQAELEAEGYEVLPFLLPACGVNAPHRRDRIWFVAHGNGTGFQKARAEQQATRVKQYGELDRATPNSCSNGHSYGLGETGQETGTDEGKKQREERDETIRQRGGSDIKRTFIEGDAANPNFCRSQRREKQKVWQHSIDGNTWGKFPTQSPVCNGNDGFSTGLDGITFSKWRQGSIQAGGNAVVPQLVLQIYKAIEQFEIEIEKK